MARGRKVVDGSGEQKECSICGEAYRLIPDDRSEWRTENGQPSKLPNDWTSKDELSHRLSHVENSKARRACAKISKLPKAVAQEIVDFVQAELL